MSTAVKALTVIIAVALARIIFSAPTPAPAAPAPVVAAAPAPVVAAAPAPVVAAAPAPVVKAGPTAEEIKTNDDLIRIKGLPPAGCGGWWQYGQRMLPGQPESRLICNIIRPEAVNRTATMNGESVQYVYPQDGSGALPMFHRYVYASGGIITATQ